MQSESLQIEQNQVGGIKDVLHLFVLIFFIMALEGIPVGFSLCVLQAYLHNWCPDRWWTVYAVFAEMGLGCPLAILLIALLGRFLSGMVMSSEWNEATS